MRIVRYLTKEQLIKLNNKAIKTKRNRSFDIDFVNLMIQENKAVQICLLKISMHCLNMKQEQHNARTNNNSYLYNYGVITRYMEQDKMNNKPNDLNKREWDIMVKYTKLSLLLLLILIAVSGIVSILGIASFTIIEVTNAYQKIFY